MAVARGSTDRQAPVGSLFLVFGEPIVACLLLSIPHQPARSLFENKISKKNKQQTNKKTRWNARCHAVYFCALICCLRVEQSPRDGGGVSVWAAEPGAQTRVPLRRSWLSAFSFPRRFALQRRRHWYCCVHIRIQVCFKTKHRKTPQEVEN